MSWLSKFTANFFSASNENTLSLASAKFDFALVKIEAPVEFGPVGLALSQRRKVEAEDGGRHRTARKLGALFEQLVPSTPALIGAYGLRVSEIINTPGINPEGSPSHGPFQSFIGADAMAMWAAATSGVPSIAVYLLACILSYAWDWNQATSLWEELVTIRKRDILEGFSRNDIVLESSLYGAQQEISREELRLWDASARSWLQSADAAKGHQKDQFLLISKNLQIPDTSGEATYAKVITVWQEVMKGMEAILQGRPQSILNHSVPLAVLSWHLFPDLIVLGREAKHVTFEDDLVPKRGTCTIGAISQMADEGQSGTLWPLALSHYHFYGGPVKAVSNQDFSRVNNVRMVRYPEGLHIAFWVREIRQKFEAPATDAQLILSKHMPWFACLDNAAQSVIDAQGDELRENEIEHLLRFGQHRAKNLLTGGKTTSTPFFGLRNPAVIAALSGTPDLECGICYYREVALRLDLKTQDCCIISRYGCIIEFVSALPFEYTIPKRISDGTQKVRIPHTRWIFVDERHMDKSSEAKERAIEWRPKIVLKIQKRIKEIQKLGERVYDLSENSDGLDTGLALSDEKGPGDVLNFRQIKGDSRLGLYLTASGRQQRQHPSLDLKYSIFETNLPYTNILEKVSTELLQVYLFLIDPRDGLAQAFFGPIIPATIPILKEISKDYKLEATCHRSLASIHYIEEVYRDLEGAMISCGGLQFDNPISTTLPVAEYSLRGHLDGAAFRKPTDYNVSLRQQAFKCIIYLESGGVEMDLNSLNSAIAVCVNNSIFVGSAILSDLFEQRLIPGGQIKRLIGDIGRSGIAVLVGPANPMIRSLSDSYNAVQYATYDFKREDNFKGTSLHLEFTKWKLPLNPSGHHTIDQDVHYVEALVSVRDNGKWVADLDLVAACEESNCSDLRFCFEPLLPCTCPEGSKPDTECVALDSWEELLDPPDAVGIFRAKGNWAARLAAASIIRQRKALSRAVLVGTKGYCLKCLVRERFEWQSETPFFVID